MSAWRLSARRHDDVVMVDLELLGDGGWMLWHLAAPVQVGRPREAQTTARHVAAASAGAVSRGRVLRCIRHAAERSGEAA